MTATDPEAIAVLVARLKRVRISVNEFGYETQRLAIADAIAALKALQRERDEARAQIARLPQILREESLRVRDEIYAVLDEATLAERKRCVLIAERWASQDWLDESERRAAGEIIAAICALDKAHEPVEDAADLPAEIADAADRKPFPDEG